jgi:WD40 repeat protein
MVELGIHVWSGSTDQTILVWDATTYQLLYSLGDHGGYVSYLSELVNIQGIVLASSVSTLG